MLREAHEHKAEECDERRRYPLPIQELCAMRSYDA